MKATLLSSAGREIAQWRRFFQARGGAAVRRAARPDAGDTVFEMTEWSDTEWSDTQPATLAHPNLTPPTTETSR